MLKLFGQDISAYLKAPNGGFVDIHGAHGKLESRKNLPIAQFLAGRGEQVRLLPVLAGAGVKSPDATRNGLAWEFKTPEGRTANAIDKALRDGSKQAVRVLLALPTDFERQVLEQALFNRVQRITAILEVAVLLADALYHFDGQEIVNNTFRGKLL